MKAVTFSTLSLIVAFVATAVKANDELSVPNLPKQHFNYANITIPSHLQQNGFSSRSRFQRAATSLDNTPTDNPITDAGATLGRVLFYDKKLSANGTVSCASCHVQQHGFADPRVLSLGFDGEPTRRHASSLANAAFYDSGKFFWDERADTLEEQVLMPFQDDVEMGLTLARLEEIVGEQPYYPDLFEHAFGNSVISSDRIAKALSQFIRSMLSTTAKYDVARAKVNSPTARFPTFTRAENRGKMLFYRAIRTDGGGRVSCASCHISEAFVSPDSDRGFASTDATSNGLDAQSSDDLGVAEATNRRRDIAKFKSPSLKNIALTAPYMHDGRFATLEQVIEHYSTGIQDHPNLPRRLRNPDGSPVKLNFSAQEKQDLIAFLNTLSDYRMLADEKWSDPFKN